MDTKIKPEKWICLCLVVETKCIATKPKKETIMKKNELKASAGELAKKLGGTVGSLRKKATKVKTTKTTKVAVVAKAEVKPVVKPTAMPAPKPAVVKPSNSVLDAILKKGAKLDGKAIVAAIDTANDILASEKAVTAFVEAINIADALAINRLSSRMSRADWYRLSPIVVKEHLRGWADDGDKNAMQALEAVDTFNISTVDVTKSLWELVNLIVRPANAVASYYQLTQLLEDLLSKGILDMRRNLEEWPDEVILITRGRDTIGYRPAKDRMMAEYGWPWLKEAEARAKERADGNQLRLDEMRSQDTGLTFAEATKGGEGYLFFKTGHNSGALLDVRSNGVVRFASTVGMKTHFTGWHDLESPIAEWEDEKLFYAFNEWRMAQAQS